MAPASLIAFFVDETDYAEVQTGMVMGVDMHRALLLIFGSLLLGLGGGLGDRARTAIAADSAAGNSSPGKIRGLVSLVTRYRCVLVVLRTHLGGVCSSYRMTPTQNRFVFRAHNIWC